MLKIRLKRQGKKKKPIYQIVVSESLNKKNGRAILNLGIYNPLKKICKFNKILLINYLKYGAYPTDTVRHLIKKILV